MILALETLTEDERLHVLAYSGKDHQLRVAPLHWRNFRLNPRVFVTSLKRRLRLPVDTHAPDCATGRAATRAALFRR